MGEVDREGVARGDLVGVPSRGRRGWSSLPCSTFLLFSFGVYSVTKRHSLFTTLLRRGHS